MAAGYTLTSEGFPNGTTVYANLVNGRAEPVSAVVSNGSAFFTGLREFENYTAHATVAGQNVQVPFSTSGEAGGGSVLLWDAGEANYMPAASRADTSQPREFIGPTDPNSIDGITLAFGDRWTPTEEPTES
jgi:hypothetical protein